MKATKNDITGDKLQTKPASDAYRDNYDKVFGKFKCGGHQYEYKQNASFDWYECVKCGHQKNKEFVP